MKSPKYLSPLIALLVFVLASTSAFALWQVDSTGTVSIIGQGLVLGDDDEIDDEDSEDSGEEDEADDVDETDSEDEEDEEDDSPGNSGSNSNKNKTKVKIKSKTKDGEVEYEFESEDDSDGTLKVIPGKEKLKVKYYDDDGEEVELETESETDVVEIEDSEYKNKVSIRTKNNASYVIKNKIAAQSRFPITVNLETNELMITTPKGTKTVTVLPDKAVENMLAANVLDQLGGKGGLRWLAQQETEDDNTASDSGDLDDDNDATDSAQVEDEGEVEEEVEDQATDSGTLAQETEEVVVDEADTVVDLTTTEDGTLAYEIEGTKTERFLWIREVELKREVIVSAETGELLAVNQSFGTDVLDFFSF